MFEAYITNTALYPLMGIEVGTTVHFPTTTQELQAALAKIGIDGKRYSEVFFTSFDSDVLGLYDHLYECENIDELNELGHALLEVRDKGGLETFEAALVLGNHTRSVAQLVQLVDVLTFVEMIVEPQHITVKAGPSVRRRAWDHRHTGAHSELLRL